MGCNAVRRLNIRHNWTELLKQGFVRSTSSTTGLSLGSKGLSAQFQPQMDSVMEASDKLNGGLSVIFFLSDRSRFIELLQIA